MAFYQAKLPGGRPYQAVFTPPVSEPIDALLSLTEEQARAALQAPTEEQLRALWPATPELFKQLHPDYVPPAPECPPCPPSDYKLIPEGEIQPAPEPTEPEPEPHVCPPCPPDGLKLVPEDWEPRYDGADIDGGPRFRAPEGFDNGTAGKYWNVELRSGADVTDQLQNMLDADQPIFLSKTTPNADVPAKCRGLVARRSYYIEASGLDQSTIEVTQPVPFIRNPADTEVSGCYAGDMKVWGNGDAPIFDHYGVSNGATHARINARKGGLYMRMRPSIRDQSAAFKFTCISPFAFNQTKGWMLAEAGNGAATTLCHVMVINSDVGRCNGPIALFKNLRAESSAIAFWNCLFDMAQDGKVATAVAQFIDCEDVPFLMETGKVTGCKGKKIIVADTEINISMRVVQMRNDPRAAFENFPALAIETPKVKVPGDWNRGVISYLSNPHPTAA